MQIPTIINNHVYPTAASRTVRQPVDKKSELYKVSQDFEALFIKQMLDVMRKTIHKEDDLLGGGLGQDVYEDMLYDEYAKKMAATAQFGLSDMIYRQLSSK
ncbi:MAG TPA: rod-binding protein [Spirochaetia bacterium]|nr:rod-binding protein [Spirochaetia bacterium]